MKSFLKEYFLCMYLQFHKPFSQKIKLLEKTIILLKKGPYSIVDWVVEFYVEIFKIVARNFFKHLKVWPKKWVKFKLLFEQKKSPCIFTDIDP